MDDSTPRPVSKTLNGNMSSRGHALARVLVAGAWLPGARTAAEFLAPLRLAISESLVTDATWLAPALAIPEMAKRARNWRGVWS